MQYVVLPRQEAQSVGDGVVERILRQAENSCHITVQVLEHKLALAGAR